MTDPVDIVKGLVGVLDAFYLEGDIISKITAEEATVKAVSKTIDVVNEGYNEALKREKIICIFKDPRFRLPPSPTVVLKSSDGKLMGIEVFPETAKEYMNRDDVFWLSDGFVIFPDVHPDKGCTEAFIMPPVAFPELNESNGCKNVVSCSPAPTCDAMLRKHRGFDESGKYASILVAFDRV